MTGNAAFHIRRLVAESFAEQIPHDEDWPLLRDLRDEYGEVFQVIYTQAGRIEWHHFWLKHLVPVFKNIRDAEGLTRHVHRVAHWKNEDAEGILTFWRKALVTDWLDNQQIAEQLPLYLSEINEEKLPLVAPLLELLLAMPRREHSFLGSAIARCVATGAADDVLLWRYVARDINDHDVQQYNFGNKLRCNKHEFGSSDDNFFQQRMEQSTILLDLALETIEKWSRLKSRYSNTDTGFYAAFLRQTSYEDSHTHTDHRHLDSERVLFDAVEAAILNHARTHSNWWQVNWKRLCFNHEGALRYFVILACTTAPQDNIDLIGRMLCDKELLESELTYELETLIQSAFVYLNASTQDSVMLAILSLSTEEIRDERQRYWTLKEQASLISPIPCHLRSPEAQAVLEAYVKTGGALIRQPSIRTYGGTVAAPFSFDVFLRASDEGVVRLLTHYSGYGEEFDDFLVGGEEQVAWQLREASSRDPLRFLHLLATHWTDISEDFCDQIMDGVATYLAHRYGNLQTNGIWMPVDEPDASRLASHILDELERHPKHWQLRRATSNALQACANVIQNSEDAARLVFLTIEFANLREESSIKGDSVDLLTTGINMITGHVAEALMILANNLQEKGVNFPELLVPTLRRFARTEHPAIRALILRRLPYLQSQNHALGWELFYRCMEGSEGLRRAAEPCLYYAYHKYFEKVAPLLARIPCKGVGKDLETWGRISALAAFSKRIDFSDGLEGLKALDSTEAWHGAASVWTHPENIRLFPELCFRGIEGGLNARDPHATIVARQMEDVFSDDAPVISIPIQLICLCFATFERDIENKHHRLFRFDKWLNALSHLDPEKALSVAEIYLSYISRVKPYLYDHENGFPQLMTYLFTEAEEREESDQGRMLQRVVFVQDRLLALGVNSINQWLQAAERQ